MPGRRSPALHKLLDCDGSGAENSAVLFEQGAHYLGGKTNSPLPAQVTATALLERLSDRFVQSPEFPGHLLAVWIFSLAAR